MAKYVYVVESAAVAGHESEFNDWYDSRHLAELQSRAGSAAMPISPALDVKRVATTLYTARGERVRAGC